ncbi:hypothetical protein ONZ45_g15138 [Pleurotus djamor]|nr:hypothetical protein ONZ45_g15138 [Pleurotus djamor]
MPSLPPELLATVVASIKHRPTLLTLCVVSTAVQPLAEGELIRETTIDHVDQGHKAISRFTTYLFEHPASQRRFQVQSLAILHEPMDRTAATKYNSFGTSYPQAIEELNTLIPQLPNLRSLFMQFLVYFSANTLRFLREPLTTVQLTHLALNLGLSCDRDAPESDIDQLKLDETVNINESRSVDLDISKFIESQPQLSILELAHPDERSQDCRVNIKDHSISLSNLKGFAGPRSFFNGRERSFIDLTHLQVPPSWEIEDAEALPDLPRLVSLSYAAQRRNILEKLLLKVKNIKCLDAVHTLKPLTNLTHIHVQYGAESGYLRYASTIFDDPNTPPSLRTVEVNGYGTMMRVGYVQRRPADASDPVEGSRDVKMRFSCVEEWKCPFCVGFWICKTVSEEHRKAIRRAWETPYQ